MEINGKIIEKAAMITGETARGSWQKLQIVIEHSPGEYPKKAMIEFWGDKAKLADNELNIGINGTFYLQIDARQSGERWYNTVRCWKYDLECKSGFVQPAKSEQSSSTATNVPNTQTTEKNETGLPF